MPFITEEIWHAIYDGKPPLKSIALAAYPQADEKQFDLAAETKMAILQDLIVERAQFTGRIESRAKAESSDPGLYAGCRDQDAAEGNRGAIERLASVESI